MFHRKFPELKISPTTLRKVFKQHRIRFKLIKKTKRVINFNIDPYRGMINELGNLIEQLQQAGLRILYLDEAIFSFNTFTGRAWAHRNNNLEVTEE
jgi:hypothetical protein